MVPRCQNEEMGSSQERRDEEGEQGEQEARGLWKSPEGNRDRERGAGREARSPASTSGSSSLHTWVNGMGLHPPF